MNFRLACLIGTILATPFGLAFVFFPELTASIYGIANWNAGTIGIARLFGVELLFVAGVLYAVRECADSQIQQGVGKLLALAAIVGCVISVQWVTSGGANALMWSTVGIYGFLMLMWGSVGFRPQT